MLFIDNFLAGEAFQNKLEKRMLLLDTSANFLVCEAFGKKDVVHRQLSGL